MALPGLLIEYLISGALALVWLAPLLKTLGVGAVQSGLLPLLAIALYVVGMSIDFLAYWLVKPLKRFLRKKAWRKYGVDSIAQAEGSVEREIIFYLYAPEIAKEVAMRSRRDRVARGAPLRYLSGDARHRRVDRADRHLVRHVVGVRIHELRVCAQIRPDAA